MTYGIQLRNETGDDLVDQTEGRTFYRKAKGTTLPHSIIPSVYTSSSLINRRMGPAAQDALPRSGAIPSNGTASYSPNWQYNEKIQYATAAFQSAIFRNTTSGISTPDVRNYAPTPISNNPDDLVFFKMPAEGVLNLYQYWLPFTGQDKNGDTLTTGLCAYCVPDSTYSGGSLEYQFVSTDLPVDMVNPFGLRLFDTNGATILFDTTREIASFVDAIRLTKAEAENVILNDASYTYTLRSPVLNAWIASEGGGAGSFRTQVGGSFREETRCLRIRQISPTQITISRRFMQSQSNVSYSGHTWSDYQEALFIIGDFN